MVASRSRWPGAVEGTPSGALPALAPSPWAVEGTPSRPRASEVRRCRCCCCCCCCWRCASVIAPLHAGLSGVLFSTRRSLPRRSSPQQDAPPAATAAMASSRSAPSIRWTACRSRTQDVPSRWTDRRSRLSFRAALRRSVACRLRLLLRVMLRRWTVCRSRLSFRVALRRWTALRSRFPLGKSWLAQLRHGMAQQSGA